MSGKFKQSQVGGPLTSGGLTDIPYGNIGLTTPLCELLRIQHPIISAPLGPDLSGPELVAAVSNAGGLGMLRAPDEDAPEVVAELIRRTRKLTARPFAMGFVLNFPYKANLVAALTESIPVVEVYWGEFTSEQVEEVHMAEATLIYQVGTVEEAKKAAAAGADVIIAQGWEAGGHVIGQIATMALVPAMVDAVSPIPVVAAGGIADARGVVASLALGAQGVCMGTRFLATKEANAHSLYKQRLTEASTDKTVYTDMFGRARWPDAPHRTIETELVATWHPKKDQIGDEKRPGNFAVGKTVISGKEKQVLRFAGTAPNSSSEGDIDSFALYAGQGVGLISEVESAGSVIENMVKEVETLVKEKLPSQLKANR